MAEAGRPQAVTTEQVLEAIRKYGTASPTELAKKIRCGRRTIYRKLQQIPKEEIDKAYQGFTWTGEDVPTEKDAFFKIPSVAEFCHTLLKRKEVSQKHYEKITNKLFTICNYLKIHPDWMTIEQCAKLIDKIKVQTVSRLNLADTKKTVRAWFMWKGISGEKLTAQGIDASQQPSERDYRTIRLTMEQRQKFMELLEKKVARFDSIDQMTILTIPQYLYETGTRILGTLKSEIDGKRSYLRIVDPIRKMAIHRVVDKGTKGGKLWSKKIVGDLYDKVFKLAELRKTGRLFTLGKSPHEDYRTIRELFKECYKEAEIPKSICGRFPCHIWRHTACQDMLDATGRNYDLVAEVLGWDGTAVMKKHYGGMSEEIAFQYYLKAKGEHIEIEIKEFKFL